MGMIFRATISKEEVNELPLLTCEGREILVIEDIETAIRECELLSRCALLGFDTETRPSFKKGERHKVSLLQLADEQCCRLFRLNKIGFPDKLSDLLSAPKPLKVGLSLRDDYCQLSGRATIKPHGFIDLQKIVGKVGIEELSLQKIYAIMFGKKISKSNRLSNWEAATLQQSQMEYAALDAWACLDIYKKICDELQEDIP